MEAEELVAKQNSVLAIWNNIGKKRDDSLQTQVLCAGQHCAHYVCVADHKIFIWTKKELAKSNVR